MEESTPVIFLIMVSIAVFLLAQSFIIPVFGSERQAARRLKKRLRRIAETEGRPSAAAMLRDKYLRELSPLERQLEALPGMARLALIIEQSGRQVPAYRLMLLCLLIAVAAGGAAGFYTENPYLAIAAAVVAFPVPLIRIVFERAQRLSKFEEQLPEALDIMVRALRAGYPFASTLELVATEMDKPVSKEFGIVYADVNYGLDVRQAFMNLLERIPNMTLMTMVTAVIVQRETGGNLAETLEKISSVIRGRFRFNRRVKTLTAEGRLSAWILTLIPFVLFIAIMVTTPDYLPILIKEPMGRKIITVAFFMVLVGILWIRRLIRIDV
jgi:tight adherence protein B